MQPNKEFIYLVYDLLNDIQVETIAKAEELLAALNYEDHYIVLKNVYGMSTDKPDLSNGDYVFSIYYKSVKEFLNKAGVIFNAELLPHQQVEIAWGLFNLTEPDNVDVLSLIGIEDDSDPSYILAVLLAEMTDMEMVTIYSMLTHVDPALITTLKLSSEVDELIDDASLEVDAIKGTFSRLFKSLSGSPVYDNLVTGVKSLPVIVNGELSKLDWSKPDEDIALSVAMIVTLSGTLDVNEIITKTIDILEKKNLDTMLMMETNGKLRSLLTGD